jgi:signal transduction histidine kinase
MPPSQKKTGKKNHHPAKNKQDRSGYRVKKNKPADKSDPSLSSLTGICSLLSAGFFSYRFKNKSFSKSKTFRLLLEDCIPTDVRFTYESIIENAHPEDRQYLTELFTMPKKIRKKINGQFRMTQKIKDYKEIKYYQVNGHIRTLKENDPVLTCVVRDISKEMKQQKELQRNLEKAEESDKIKTTFLLNISHNIRTPMNSILGFAELLSMTYPEPEKLNRYIQIIKRQSKSLVQLIDHVAEIAKYESGSMHVTKTKINTNVLIKEILNETEIIQSDNRKKDILIKIEPASKKGIDIYTDAGRIHQIFINLLNYLLRYTTVGTIEIGYLMPDDNKIDFYVSSTGYFISKEELKYIFDRYSQIKTEESDRYDDETSLGLTIAKSIVHLLGGKITADSDAGTGSRFSFSIPYEKLPEKEQELPDEEPLLNTQFDWKDKVILIVEDEEVNGLFLEAVFQETGARTLYAKNGKQAVELCRSINKIDLILMDIKMPVMNGIKATTEIRKFNRTIPIIAQTALTLQEDNEQFLKAGCNDSIAKPIEVEELLSLVNNYFTH